MERALMSNTFPCPVCQAGLQVRASKKNKPYVVCDPCGVQMFVRNEPGIRTFERIVTEGKKQAPDEDKERLRQRYLKKCPKCKKFFWVSEKLIVTSWVNGEFEGYRCPEEQCDGIVKREENKL